MRMSKYLDILSRSTDCTLDILRKAHFDWLNASTQMRDEFVQCRKMLVKKMGGCFLEGSDALKMQSSGVTTGSKKTYYWGPSWRSHHDFFEWLKFQPYKFDLLLYIKPTPHINNISITPMPVLENMSFIVAMNPNRASHAEELKRHVGEKRVIFWLMPSYAKLLIDREFKFDLFPPDTNYIYATGEHSTKETSTFFRDKGYHYIDAMRSWMGGATFITCEYGKTHWIKMVADVSKGANDELITTDLFNLAQPFVNFETLDYVKWTDGKICKCGLEDNQIEFQNRDTKLPIGNNVVPFSDIFSEFNAAIALKHKTKDMFPLLFCSFGYHQASGSLFILYEVKKSTPIIGKDCLKEFVIRAKLNVRKVYAINNYQSNQFKIAKIFNVSNKEAAELESIASVKVGI